METPRPGIASFEMRYRVRGSATREWLTAPTEPHHANPCPVLRQLLPASLGGHCDPSGVPADRAHARPGPDLPQGELRSAARRVLPGHADLPRRQPVADRRANADAGRGAGRLAGPRGGAVEGGLEGDRERYAARRAG